MNSLYITTINTENKQEAAKMRFNNLALADISKNKCNALIHTGRYAFHKSRKVCMENGIDPNSDQNKSYYSDGKLLFVFDLDVKINGAISIADENVEISGEEYEQLKGNEKEKYSKYGVDFPLSIVDSLGIPQTLTISTGSGGKHLYYWIITDKEIEISLNSNFAPVEKLTPYLNAIDIRANSGIVFAPGTKFKQHLEDYHIERDVSITSISYETMMDIFDKLSVDRSKFEVCISGNDAPTKTEIKEKVSTAIKNIEVKNFPEIPIRKGFEMLLSGELDFHLVKEADGNTAEFQMWKLLHREAHCCGQDMAKIKELLSKNQPSFDITKYDYQSEHIKYDKDYNKRPTRQSYFKYFGKYLPEDSINDEYPTYQISRKIYVQMKENGIFQYKERQTDDGIVLEEERCYEYKNFDIKSSYKRFGYLYYNFDFDGKSYYSYNYNQMLNILKSKCGLSKAEKYSNILLPKFIDSVDIEDYTENFSQYCGYNDGWKLDSSCVEMPNQTSVQNNRNRIFNLNMTPNKEQIDIFHKLYNMTSIKYKDIIIAYGLVAPMLYDLKKYYSVAPHLYLIGAINSGKTSMAKLITMKFYGHTDTIYSPSTSIPNLEAVIASSTFPICIDEVENFGKNKDDNRFISNLKTTTTSEFNYTRQNQDTTLKFSIPYQAAIVETCNYIPIALNDSAYRNRCIILDIPETENKDSFEWKKCYNKLQDGFITPYLVEYMKIHPLEEIIEIVNNTASENRTDAIINILNIGKYLAKEIFGLDLTLDYSVLITENQQITDIFEQIKFQCSRFDTDINGSITATNDWVKVGVFKIKDEYRYCQENLNDLNKLLDQSYPLKKLYDILSCHWKDVSPPSQERLGKRRVMCIKIPKKYISMDNEEIKIENILDNRFPNMELIQNE